MPHDSFQKGSTTGALRVRLIILKQAEDIIVQLGGEVPQPSPEVMSEHGVCRQRLKAREKRLIASWKTSVWLGQNGKSQVFLPGLDEADTNNVSQGY